MAVRPREAAYNLKVTGSNPAPATKKLRLIRDLKAEHNARLLLFQILVNTWPTFCQSPLKSGGLLRFGAGSRRQIIAEAICLVHALVQDGHDTDVAI